MSKVVRQDIVDMLKCFAKKQYSTSDETEEHIAVLNHCKELMSRDYSIVEVPNPSRTISANYPSTLLIPEQETTRYYPFAGCSSISSDLPSGSTVSGSNNAEQLFDGGKLNATLLRTMISNAKMARCRTRFPVPVILFRGKYVCRSATIAREYEVYGRSSYEYLQKWLKKLIRFEDENSDESQEGTWFNLEQLRQNDIGLLKALNVKKIFDFMVEDAKVKYYFYVSSSEKAEENQKRYSDWCDLVVVPYPGCEFFEEYAKNNYDPSTLVYDWSQSIVNAVLTIPNESIKAELNIDWQNYKSWDLPTLTINYLKLLLKYLQNGDSGILIHCISGWDRTPLFVSMLRISLWADGEIHQSLSAMEVLYLTLGYDWLLFGHDLPDRIAKNEMILHCCFNMLKYIRGDDFSIKSTRCRSNRSSGSSIEVLRTDSEILPEGVLLDRESRGSSVSLNSVTSIASGKSSKCDTQSSVSSGIGLTGNGASNSIAITGGNSGACGNIGATSGMLIGSEGINSCSGSSSYGCISQDSSNPNSQSSPPIKSSRTSPVAVPVTKKSPRQRYESGSSQSAGSWQMIGPTGSYRSSESINELMQQAVSPQRPRRRQLSNSQEPSNTSPQQPQAQADSDNHSPQSASTSSASQSTSQESSSSVVRTERHIRITELRDIFYGCAPHVIKMDYNPGESLLLGLWDKYNLITGSNETK